MTKFPSTGRIHSPARTDQADRGSRTVGSTGAGFEAAFALITADRFAQLAQLSRRQIDRLRKQRPAGFPREYELGSGG